MEKLQITNATLLQIDWSADDRQKFLKTIDSGCRQHKDKPIAPGIGCKNVLMQDVSGGDPRSVKAQLRGAGDHRAAWWKLVEGAMRFFLPSQSLEVRMFNFHRTHHAVTFGRLQFLADVGLLARMIREKGVLSGYKQFKSLKSLT